MKKYYYQRPTFKLWRESWGPTIKLARRSRVSCPRVICSQILGSCSYFYIMPNNSNPKIKHKTLYKKYEDGGIKKSSHTQIKSKTSSQFMRKKTNNHCFHEWKIIPLYQLNQTFDPFFRFHSNHHFNKSSIKILLPFYIC